MQSFFQESTGQPEVPNTTLVLGGWAVGILVVIIVGAYVVKKIRIFFRRPELLGTSRDDLRKKWSQIEAMAARGDEMSLKLSVMEADKLLDHALKSMGFGGESMGERLKLVVYKYPRVRRAWMGHTVRNQLVHETSYHLSRSTARQALSSFKDALSELGIV
ncbi:hypothetical protein HY627_00685 [Candidatus Uhrbacteria bacterium]|nr:hypothetical protein [Candidatus Uhrbacteria bacterium]